jgi:hypothetical protein
MEAPKDRSDANVNRGATWVKPTPIWMTWDARGGGGIAGNRRDGAGSEAR